MGGVIGVFGEDVQGVPSTVVSARRPYFEDGKGILHAVSTPEAQAGEIDPVLTASPEYPVVGIEVYDR